VDWSEKSGEEETEEEGMSMGADRSGECWDFEYQRCMGCDSFGRTDMYDQSN
jgi:hypothetical protein